tara:strand:- start:3556 stop:4521 length:966 start_codon:yes stop_codon:yes gene_type:complete
MNLNELPWLDKVYKKINFNNLPHGIILNGPDGLGKYILGNEIARTLLVNNNDSKSINLFNLNTHPDFLFLNKDKILTRHISFRDKEWDQELGNRNVIDFLSMTPSISSNKVVLINNAHTMNEVSQNALLKSLEEPALNSYIILITNRSNSLLQTIYSRCQTLNMPSLTDDEINSWLVSRGISDFNTKDFPSYISPINILNDIENNQHMIFKDFVKLIKKFLSNQVNSKQILQYLSSYEIDLITKINYLIEFLKILLRSKILNEELSGLYKDFNKSDFSTLKLSNIINDLHNLRFDYFKVPQINENHVFNYYFSELKNSIKL